MRQFIRIILWAVVIVAAVAVTIHYLREPDIAVAEETYRFESAQKDAVKAGNHVVYSRHLVNNAGRPAWTAAFSHWKTLPSAAPAGAPVQVVFVHGYNTTFAESIVRGNYLSRQLRSWTAQKNPEVALDFTTFSWRADFGPDNFHTAELAASVQSASFTQFLKSLVRPGAPAPKIIVITHSLGARLVLDALAKHGAEKDFPAIAALLMVQPAVPRTAVSRGTYDTRHGDTVSSQRYAGEFYAALAATGPAFATASSADDMLGQYFNTSTDLAGVPAAPKLNTALGQPYFSATEAEQFPDNFRLIDLSPGRYVDMALPGHDSLYDAGGRRALWSLWNRVLRAALAIGPEPAKPDQPAGGML